MKNYIGNNNEINKKKYKKSLPPKLNSDAGNVEHNIEMFNKVSSGDVNLSSAAGMNGMAESYDRESLIARITEFGKHYNFDKYTDVQLNAMLNRLVDASNHKKKVLPKHQDRIDIQNERHVMNDDPSYNFDDPDREGEYRVESLREALNRLDHSCIDNDKQFHDLRSLYENIQHQLTPQEKQELKKLVDTTNDPDAVKAYLDSKDPDKKNEELEESVITEEMNATDIVDWMYRNFPNWEYIGEKSLSDYDVRLIFADRSAVRGKRTEIPQEFIDALNNQNFDYKFLMSNHRLDITAHDYDLTSLDDSDVEYTNIEFDESIIKEALEKATDKSSGSLIAFIEQHHPEIVPVNIDGYLEWYDKIDAKIKPLIESNDNLTYDELMKLAQEHYKDGGADIIDFWDENSLKEYEKEFGPLTKKQALRLMKVMGNVSRDEEEAGEYFAKQTFDEGLNRKELETFSRAIFNAGDKKEALEIIDQIYQYDKELSLQLKDMWDESASDAYNTDKLSGYLLRYLDESLNEDTVKQGNKWVNKGKEGTHGKFNTKKQADAQRKAMFANGYKGESLQEDSDEYYTKLISKDLGPAVQEFMNSSEVNGQQIRNAVVEFFDEYNKIPSKGMDSLDIKYDCDKDRFYQKYRPFVDKCKEVSNKLRPTGYGKTDYFDIKAKELLKKVDYNFPYGWKVYKGISERQSVAEDIDSTLAARERKDRIEYLKNQIKEETKDWQTKFGDKGSVDIFKENDKKIRYVISPFIRQDNGESLDVIEKTFKEIIRKTNKYFNLEGNEKFRLKLNPMFVTIICP